MIEDDQKSKDDDDRELDEHRRAVTRDRAYARRMDEKQIRERAVEAFDLFIGMGFTAHLIAVQVRGAIEYRISLYPDGQRNVAIEQIQSVARDFNFDLQIEQDPNYETGWVVLLYPLS